MAVKWPRWIVKREARFEKRQALPQALVHYWDGGMSRTCSLRNISLSGMYIEAGDRWFPNTIIKVMLEARPARRDKQGKGRAVAICVLAKVVRADSSGVGLEFVLAGGRNSGLLRETNPDCATTRRGLRDFLACVEGELDC